MPPPGNLPYRAIQNSTRPQRRGTSTALRPCWLIYIYICVRKEDVKIRGALQPTTQHHSGMVSMENRVLSTTQRAAKGASLL